MISVKEAKEILFKNLPKPNIAEVGLKEAAGMVLAEDLYSPMDVPSFDNSAMDGYAFSFDDFQRRLELKVNYTLQAGQAELPELNSGEAARIFTGAPVPSRADTVVMQEITEVVDGKLKILESSFERGANIRKKASQTAKGTLVGQCGISLNPALLGFLAGLGISQVKIFKAPRVSILTSGKELVQPGNPLKAGQIYESNSFALYAALKELGIQTQQQPIVDDEAEKVKSAVKTALTNTDILLITGGISVGDYDFVHMALEEAGVSELFYKISQKPGKPLFAGKNGNQLVFGLPGNPASALTCFYQYVKPCILMLMSKQEGFQIPQSYPMLEDFRKKPGLTQFMKGVVQEGKVKVLTDQESYKMNSFAQSNCLVELDAEKTNFQEGELVKVHLL